jgi:hypothetical protein
MQRVHDIESDTPIVPRAVAEAVWEEAAVWLKAALPRRWIGELLRARPRWKDRLNDGLV